MQFCWLLVYRVDKHIKKNQHAIRFIGRYRFRKASMDNIITEKPDFVGLLLGQRSEKISFSQFRNFGFQITFCDSTFYRNSFDDTP